MIKKLTKQLMKPANILIIVLLVVVIAVIMKQRENFSKSVRYMYMYNPTSKNSSYDIRGEPIDIIKEDTGILHDSSYDANYSNQRVRKYFKKFQMEPPSVSDQYKLLIDKALHD
jgi:hypothetical protein